MPTIYDQHSTAFRDLSAYVVLKDGRLVARVAFKYGARVWCYFHVLGSRMVRAYAGGGGYDRKSAAAWSAVQRIEAPTDDAPTAAHVAALQAAIKDQGASWDRDLESAGYTVLQAV